MSDTTRLQRPTPFFEGNRNLFTSWEAFRKQIERRRTNGMAPAGAVIETSLGLMIDPERFHVWLLKPTAYRQRRAEARAA